MGTANIFFPPICSICGDPLRSEDETICKACRSSFSETGKTVCHICGCPRPRQTKRRCPGCPPDPIYFQSVRAAFTYAGGRMGDGFCAFKYGQRHELGRVLARAMFMAFARVENQERPPDPNDPTGFAERLDGLVPVPLHYFRRLRRGYNQAEVLAREFSALAGIPCRSELLARRRRTSQQANLPRDRRAQNVKGAFEAPYPNEIRDLRIGVVDDIMTTGSTVNECARALKSAGAAEVHVLALARAGSNRQGS